MFKYFKNISRVNKVWQLLNERYFNAIEGKTGNTVIKIDEKSESMNYLLVHTDNQNVVTILSENEQDILRDLKNKFDISVIGIRIV